MRVNISLDEELLKQVDLYAAEHNIGRSELIADSLENEMRPKNSAEIVEKWSPKVLESILEANKLVDKLQSMASGITKSKDIDIPGFGTYKDMVSSSTVEQVAVNDKVTGPNPVLPAKIEPEYLWDDHNLMPVYKQGEDNQFCAVFHQKGLKQRVYLIKKFRADGSIELEGKYCRSCIEGFLKQDGHLE